MGLHQSRNSCKCRKTYIPERGHNWWAFARGARTSFTTTQTTGLEQSARNIRKAILFIWLYLCVSERVSMSYWYDLHDKNKSMLYANMSSWYNSGKLGRTMMSPYIMVANLGSGRYNKVEEVYCLLFQLTYMLLIHQLQFQ